MMCQICQSLMEATDTTRLADLISATWSEITTEPNIPAQHHLNVGINAVISFREGEHRKINTITMKRLRERLVC